MWTVWLAVQTSPHLDTIWPTSLIGLIGSMTAVLSFFILLVSLWRADKKPVLAKIEEARAAFTDQLRRIEHDVDQKLDDYHTTVTAEINGWAKRHEDDHADLQRHEIALGEQAGKIIRMESQREHSDRRMSEIVQRVDEMTRELRDLERRMSKTVTESEQRIIAAIHRHLGERA